MTDDDLIPDCEYARYESPAQQNAGAEDPLPPSVYVVQEAPAGAICTLCSAPATVAVRLEHRESSTVYCDQSWRPIEQLYNERGHTVLDERATSEPLRDQPTEG